LQKICVHAFAFLPTAKSAAGFCGLQCALCNLTAVVLLISSIWSMSAIELMNVKCIKRVITQRQAKSDLSAASCWSAILDGFQSGGS
jgi:hypothetical protein